MNRVEVIGQSKRTQCAALYLVISRRLFYNDGSLNNYGTNCNRWKLTTGIDYRDYFYS